MHRSSQHRAAYLRRQQRLCICLQLLKIAVPFGQPAARLARCNSSRGGSRRVHQMVQQAAGSGGGNEHGRRQRQAAQRAAHRAQHSDPSAMWGGQRKARA